MLRTMSMPVWRHAIALAGELDGLDRCERLRRCESLRADNFMATGDTKNAKSSLDLADTTKILSVTFNIYWEFICWGHQTRTEFF